MQPIEPLIAEHSLIMRMIAAMRTRAAQMEHLLTVDGAFVDGAVDFIRTYADRCHHGKEETILFHEIDKKTLPGPLRKVLEELLEEHEEAREHTRKILAGKREHLEGHPDAWRRVTGHMRALIALYPAHIRKEEDHFFHPAMAFLDEREQREMLEKFRESDRRLIHEHYTAVVDEWAPMGTPVA